MIKIKFKIINILNTQIQKHYLHTFQKLHKLIKETNIFN